MTDDAKRLASVGAIAGLTFVAGIVLARVTAPRPEPPPVQVPGITEERVRAIAAEEALKERVMEADLRAELIQRSRDGTIALARKHAEDAAHASDLNDAAVDYRLAIRLLEGELDGVPEGPAKVALNRELIGWRNAYATVDEARRR